MNDWANYFAIVPPAGSIGNANCSNLAEGEGFSSGAASGLPSHGYGRKLFLRVLLGSLFLVAGSNPAQAANESNLATESITRFCQQMNPAFTLSSQPAPGMGYLPFGAFEGRHSSSFNRRRMPCKQPNTEQPDTFLNPSNGAILAHQITASSKPMPTARAGVAANSSLREGLNIKEIQICTQGYSVAPGIPNPVFIQNPKAAGHRPGPFCLSPGQMGKTSKDQLIRNL